MGYVFRCPECRTRRTKHALMASHIRESGHRLCLCGGYHYKHRPGSPYCERNPVSIIYLAARGGEPEESLALLAMSIASEQPELAGRVEQVCRHMNLRMAA